MAVDVETRELWRLGARSQVIYLKLCLRLYSLSTRRGSSITSVRKTLASKQPFVPAPRARLRGLQTASLRAVLLY
jgi:hypothetical protein